MFETTATVKVKQMRHGFGSAPSSVVSGWGICGQLAVSAMVKELKQWVGVGGVGDGGREMHSQLGMAVQ